MQLTLQMPDKYFFNYKPQNLSNQVKLHTALMLYRSKQISAGAACEIAGIDRYTFINECKQNEIPIISYGIEEIESELEQFQIQ